MTQLLVRVELWLLNSAFHNNIRRNIYPNSKLKVNTHLALDKILAQKQGNKLCYTKGLVYCSFCFLQTYASKMNSFQVGSQYVNCLSRAVLSRALDLQEVAGWSPDRTIPDFQHVTRLLTLLSWLYPFHWLDQHKLSFCADWYSLRHPPHPHTHARTHSASIVLASTNNN